MATYQGHKNRNHWNVALWIGNDEGLYNMARSYVRRSKTLDIAAIGIFDALQEMGVKTTPDNVPYSVTAIRQAIRDL